MSIKNLLGKRIKEIRKEHGLTQEEFAEMINISQRTLSGIEVGKNFLTSQTLDKILEVFEMQPDDLFKLKNLRSAKELKKEITKALENMPEHKIRVIYSIVDAIK
ncbi:helix-turn-helix transcriptional regulator [bacterium]|nr:helix-turn-helix transcriptional regulator [bacterium]